MIVYGKQIFLYLLDKHPNKIQKVFLTKEIDKKLFNKIIKNNIKIERIDAKKAQAMARGGNHQGFLLEIGDYEFANKNDLKYKNFILILAGLTDVGNIGAIIRSAYALGVDGVVISKISNINIATIARTSVGAIFDMPIVIEKDLISIINEFKQTGFFIYCADMNGENVNNIKFNDKKVLVVGSEGEGLSKKVLKFCDKSIKIEMSRDFDSLNVSVACAILCDRMRDGK